MLNEFAASGAFAALAFYGIARRVVCSRTIWPAGYLATGSALGLMLLVLLALIWRKCKLAGEELRL